MARGVGRASEETEGPCGAAPGGAGVVAFAAAARGRLMMVVVMVEGPVPPRDPTPGPPPSSSSSSPHGGRPATSRPGRLPRCPGEHSRAPQQQPARANRAGQPRGTGRTGRTSRWASSSVGSAYNHDVSCLIGN